MPVRFAGIGPLPSHPVVCAQFPERRKLSPNLLPLFPVDLTDASAQPFIGASDEFRHRRRREIVDPATDESLQLLSVLFKASADFSRQALLHRPVGAVSMRSPRVEHALSPHIAASFTPTVPCSYWTSSCLADLSTVICLMRFLFIISRACLQLLSAYASRRTPCFWL